MARGAAAPAHHWLKASAASKNNHTLYFRHRQTKKRKVLKDEQSKTLRPQDLTALGEHWTLDQIDALAA